MFDHILTYEHYKGLVGVNSAGWKGRYQIPFKAVGANNERYCAIFFEQQEGWFLELSYFIGLDWVNEGQYLHVNPKLNGEQGNVDYLRMLMEALRHPDALS